MEFPILQFVSPAPTPVAADGNSQAAAGFADLIDALLDSLVGSGETDTDHEKHPEPDREDEGSREPTPVPGVAASTLPSVVMPLLVAQQSLQEVAPAEPVQGPEVQATGDIASSAIAPVLAEKPLLPDAEDVLAPGSDVSVEVEGVRPPEVESPSEAPHALEPPVRRPTMPSTPAGDTEPLERADTPTYEESAEPVEQTRPSHRPVEPSRVDESQHVPSAGEPSAGVDVSETVERPDLGFVVDRIEEWLERTGGAEPTTIALELPDPDGDLVVKVGLRDGMIHLNVIRPGGEAPTWLVDRLDEALARHGFEMAGDDRRQPADDETPEQPVPAPSRLRRSGRRDGLWI